MLSVRSIDPLRDEQLRQWAREHYVTVAERSPAWHPLVLAEMQRIDAERLEAAHYHQGSKIVPLQEGPEPVLRHDAGQQQIRKPRMLSPQSDAEISSDLYLG